MLYQLIDDLLYFNNEKKGLRLYVLIVIKVEVFKFAYNKINYLGYTRIHERFTKEFYIFNIIIKFHEFIRYCPHYQIN